MFYRLFLGVISGMWSCLQRVEARGWHEGWAVMVW